MHTCFSTLPTLEKARLMLTWLEEHKGVQPVCLDLAGRCAFTECLIVATGMSVRHAQSLADGLAALCREHGFEFLRLEGRQSGQWILLDCNDIIVNIFQEATRALYGLESLWGAALAGGTPERTATSTPQDTRP